MIDLKKILALMTVLIVAASATGDVVVARWGAAGKVQHAGTLTYEDGGKAGLVMRFDLSALPRGAKVYRARLVMSRSGGYRDSFDASITRVSAGGTNSKRLTPSLELKTSSEKMKRFVLLVPTTTDSTTA